MRDNCKQTRCANCNCEKLFSGAAITTTFPANSPLAPSKRPSKVIRRDPFKAIIDLQKRYSESMNILS